MTGFRMPFKAGHTLVFELVPNNFAGGFIERQQAPALLDLVICGFDVAIKAHFQISLNWGNRRGDINPIAPDDRGGVRESRDWRAPKDVFAGLNIPVDRCSGAGIHPGRLGPAELRPIASRTRVA